MQEVFVLQTHQEFRGRVLSFTCSYFEEHQGALEHKRTRHKEETFSRRSHTERGHKKHLLFELFKTESDADALRWEKVLNF